MNKKNNSSHLGGYIVGGDKRSHDPNLWKWINAELKVDSVLDIGCGEGHTIKYFQDHGINVLGIDGSKFVINNNLVRNKVILHDFSKAKYLPDRCYDLVWSSEFVEHVDQEFTDNFLITFKSARKYIFLTSPPPKTPGWHHVNCQHKKYWIEKIEKQGFKFNFILTLLARSKSTNYLNYFFTTGLVFVNNNHNISFYEMSKYIFLLFLSIPLILFRKIRLFFLYSIINLDQSLRKIGIFVNKFDPKLYCFLKKNISPIFRKILTKNRK